MSSTNGSGRPTGSVTIPVEIIRDSSSTGPQSHSRQNSPYRTVLNDNSYSGFSDSSPRGSNSNARFQPRHSPNTAYDRVIHNSQFNQPTHDYPSYPQYQDSQFRHSPSRMYDSNLSQLRRSHEDLLSTPFESLHTNTQPFSSFMSPFGSGFPNDSDFIQPMRFSSPNRRSFDALNDSPDMHQNFPSTRQYQSEQPQPQQQQPNYRTTYQTQYQPQSQQQQPNYGNQSFYNPNIVYTDEFGQPTDHYHQNTFQGSANNAAHDRSHSPAPKRGASPVQPSPTPQQQPEQEPELKMASDSDGPIPMPGPSSPANSTSAPTTQPTEQQAPSTEANAPTMNTATPQPEPVRDPNTIALEKLEQMKQMLSALEKDVDAFNGSTRNDLAYKMLDEQALKIMICCDELVDVSADIKDKRKEMIRNVQRAIGKLESKVPSTPAVENNSNPMEIAIASPTESNVTTNEGVASNATLSTSNSQNTSATEQSVPS
ncbi:unnamed protein product [Adineta ricciae]|uniref:BAG domain-containing protein n=1 Tax=Adineta ricciae TaxID=249248 RepID=A0A815INM2_ADIRI|nr:unnamed protein product [Adineta ricciae]